MTVTKHYCDACDKEMPKGGHAKLKCHIDFPTIGGYGNPELDLTGEFCCFTCAAAFVTHKGKPLKVEAA